MKKGFTLLELLVSVAIFIGVLGISISTIALQTVEKRRLSRDVNLNQNLTTIIERLKREVLSSNGSNVYPVLKGLYVNALIDDDKNPLPKNNDGLICLSSGLKNLENSDWGHYPTVDSPPTDTTNAECVGGSNILPVAFLVSSKNFEGREFLYLRTFYIDKVSRNETANKFKEHNAIFYDEYVFSQKTFIDKYYNYLDLPVNLPGPEETFPLSASKKAVKLTSDNIDVKKFRLYARPGSCLTKIPPHWIQFIIEGMSAVQYYEVSDLIRRQLAFFAPLNPKWYGLFEGMPIDLNNTQKTYIFRYTYTPSGEQTGADLEDWFNKNFILQGVQPDGTIVNNEEASSLNPTSYILSDCKQFGAPLLRVEIEIAPTPILFNDGQEETLPFYEKDITAKETVDLSFPF